MQTIDTNRHSKCFQVLYEDLTTVAKNIPNSAVQPHMNWSWGLLAQSPSFSIQAWVARPNWWKMTPPNHGNHPPNNLKQALSFRMFSVVEEEQRREHKFIPHRILNWAPGRRHSLVGCPTFLLLGFMVSEHRAIEQPLDNDDLDIQKIGHP